MKVPDLLCWQATSESCEEIWVTSEVVGVVFAIRGMVLIPFFVDRPVIRKTEPTVFMATTLAYYNRQESAIEQRQYGRLTCNMITATCLLGGSAATRALFGSLLEVFRCVKLSGLLGSLALRCFVAA